MCLDITNSDLFATREIQIQILPLFAAFSIYKKYLIALVWQGSKFFLGLAQYVVQH